MGFGALKGNVQGVSWTGDATFSGTLYGLAYGYEEAALLHLKAGYEAWSEEGDRVDLADRTPTFHVYTWLAAQYHGRIRDELKVWVEVPLDMTWDEGRFYEIREMAGASADESFDESKNRLEAAEERLAEIEERQAEEGGLEEDLADARKVVEAASAWRDLGDEIYRAMGQAEDEARKTAAAQLAEAMGKVPHPDGRFYAEAIEDGDYDDVPLPEDYDDYDPEEDYYGECDVFDDMEELVDRVFSGAAS